VVSAWHDGAGKTVGVVAHPTERTRGAHGR
jgi:hypothetical protein